MKRYLLILIAFLMLSPLVYAGPEVTGGSFDPTSPGAIGGTTPADATFNDVTISAGKHLLLPLHNDAVTPTLAFGDGNTGFYESADNTIRVAIGGAGPYYFISGGFYTAAGTDRFSLLNEETTSTNPVICPARTDTDTGIGRAAADQLSLIAGGVEGMRITENTTIAVAAYGPVTTPATATPGISGVDSDQTDADTSWQIYGNATATGSGVEVVDVFFQAQGAAGTPGTLETFMYYDSSEEDLIINSLFRRVPIIAIVSTAHPSNTPDTEVIGTYIGLGFDDDTDNALFTFEIPGDWDGTSSPTLQIYYAFASAPADGETVKFDISYRSRAETEDIDTGNATAGTVTQTISVGAGETTVGYLFEDSIALTYNDGDNPLTAGDLIGISFDRDDTGDTEDGEAIIVLFELKYQANKLSQY